MTTKQPDNLQLRGGMNPTYACYRCRTEKGMISVVTYGSGFCFMCRQELGIDNRKG